MMVMLVVDLGELILYEMLSLVNFEKLKPKPCLWLVPLVSVHLMLLPDVVVE